eukprot:6082925-Pyramimonas_sp.AAC.1
MAESGGRTCGARAAKVLRGREPGAVSMTHCTCEGYGVDVRGFLSTLPGSIAPWDDPQDKNVLGTPRFPNQLPTCVPISFKGAAYEGSAVPLKAFRRFSRVSGF